MPTEVEILRAQVELLRECHNFADEALEQIANFAPEVTHGWADHVRQVAKHALRGD